MKLQAAAFAFAVLAGGSAHAQTCTKSGEEISGIGKVCYYRCLGGAETLNVGAASVCPISIDKGGSGPGRGSRLDESRMGGSPGPGACYKAGEMSSGTTRACVYSCSGTRRVMTISVAQLCPLTP